MKKVKKDLEHNNKLCNFVIGIKENRMQSYILTCILPHDKRNIVRFRRVFVSRWFATFFYCLARLGRFASYIELTKRYTDRFGNICSEIVYCKLLEASNRWFEEIQTLKP